MARTPRVRHLRHREYDRLRHSQHFIAWLDAQAVRLAITPAAVFALLQGGMTAEQVEGNASATVPANTAAPTITGTGTVGQVLTAHPGTWTGNPTPTLTYAWKRDSVVIAGQTATTYTLVSADSTHSITVTVTATNGKGTANSTSAPVAVT